MAQNNKQARIVYDEKRKQYNIEIHDPEFGWGLSTGWKVYEYGGGEVINADILHELGLLVKRGYEITFFR